MKAFSEGMDTIDDLSKLVIALHELERLEEKYDKPFMYTYIQQSMLGGTCYPTPTDHYIHNTDYVCVLATYDRIYIKDKILEKFLIKDKIKEYKDGI